MKKLDVPQPPRGHKGQESKRREGDTAEEIFKDIKNINATQGLVRGSMLDMNYMSIFNKDYQELKKKWLGD